MAYVLGDVPGSGTLWISIWLTLNLILTISNKAFFQLWGFPFPIILSATHATVSAVLSFAVSTFLGIKGKKLAYIEHVYVFLFSVLFTMNIMVGNLAVNFATVSLVQVIRSIIPGITMGLSIWLLGSNFTTHHYYSVFLVITGVSLASAGEMDFVMIGFLCTLLACGLSSLKSVLSSNFLTGSLSFHPLILLCKMSSFASIQLLIWAILAGENVQFIEWWTNENTKDRAFVVGCLLLNSIIAFSLNMSNFITTKKTSALTITIAGNVKHVATIAASVIVFKNPISLLNAIGSFMAFTGAGWYSILDYKEKKVKIERIDKSNLSYDKP